MVDGQGTSIQIAHVGMVHVDGVCGRMDDVLIFSFALRCARSNRFFFCPLPCVRSTHGMPLVVQPIRRKSKVKKGTGESANWFN